VVITSQPIVLDRTRVYVIGDIHGRSDLLDRMAVQISRDLDSNPTDDCLTVTLGDYMDRGPDHGKGARLFLERDHNMDLRFAAFVGFVLHNDAYYDFRILCARLRPLVLNNLQLFGLCEHPLHEYRPVPFRRSYPDVVVVQPGQEWNGDNGTGALESLRRCWKSTPEGDQSSHPNGAITTLSRVRVISLGNCH
jgi:hypothetical protein